MSKWKLTKIELPLKFNWHISRGQTTKKENFLIEYKDGEFYGRSEIAFNVRFNESAEKVVSQFDSFVHQCPTELHSLEQIHSVFSELSICNSLKFGIESAFLHFLSDLTGDEIHKILSVNRVQRVETSFSIPILPLDELENFFNTHSLNRFKSLKVKIQDTRQIDFINILSSMYDGKIRVDANEGFQNVEDVLEFCEEIVDSKIEFLEQPLPASQLEMYADLKKYCPFPLIADESVTSGVIGPEYKEFFDGVNIKLMKSGGYYKALKQLREARALGLKTMVGCMVETSLGISCGMNIAFGCDYADLDGFLLLEKDPMGLVTEEKGNLFYSHLH